MLGHGFVLNKSMTTSFRRFFRKFSGSENSETAFRLSSTSNSSSEKGLSIFPSPSGFRSNSKQVSKRYQAIDFLPLPLLALSSALVFPLVF